MTMWTVGQIVEATNGRLVSGYGTDVVCGISIDSRCIQPGEAFVAIRGLRFDGHNFVNEAIRRAASCLILSHACSSTEVFASVPIVLVEDTTEALGDLARFHHRRMNTPVVAVTGSCGKTTTKELVAHLLGGPQTILKSSGTQNNQIGVPLTLLRLRSNHKMAVVELGSNHPGEIAYLSSIVEPEVAIITNVGPVHLEFLGSLMGVLQEKISLLDALPPYGTAILSGDQIDICLEAQHHLHPNARVVTFGSTDRCDIQVLDVQRLPQGMTIRLRDRAEQWTIPLLGYHNVENALAALGCAWSLGVPLSEARQRILSFEAMPLRSQLVRCNGLTILNDCYNANPLSFARALETLRDLDTRRKIAIVGDMLELGHHASSAHQAIGRLAARLGIDAVIAVGEYADYVARGVQESRSNNVTTCRTVQELIDQLPIMLREGDGLLVKGSRKLQLERVTEFLLQLDKENHANSEVT